MQITGTHFNYYFICHRKLWLFAFGIHMEQTSDLVYEGKLIHETSYQQRSERYKEIEIGGIKIDYYDTKTDVIHEIKKSEKMEEAHLWQVKYYMHVLKKYGFNVVKSIIEYPLIRKKTDVYLSDTDEHQITVFIDEICNIIKSEKCPTMIKTRICKKCSYFDFCCGGEE